MLITYLFLKSSISYITIGLITNQTRCEGSAVSSYYIKSSGNIRFPKQSLKQYRYNLKKNKIFFLSSSWIKLNSDYRSS